MAFRLDNVKFVYNDVSISGIPAFTADSIHVEYYMACLSALHGIIFGSDFNDCTNAGVAGFPKYWTALVRNI